VIVYAFHREAEAEFTAAALFYESRTDGLGAAFVDAVERAVSLICQYPESGAPIAVSRRRMLVSGFPYAIVYRLDVDLIVILALAHTRRRPAYWRARE
jgi:toxin ParE1/3/4